MEHRDANAALARDGREVVRDMVVRHAIGKKLAHVAAEQTRGEHVVAQLHEHAAHVEALAARSLLGHDAVHVIDHQVVDVVRRVDGRVHRYRENHGSSLKQDVSFHIVTPAAGPRDMSSPAR